MTKHRGAVRYTDGKHNLIECSDPITAEEFLAELKGLPNAKTVLTLVPKPKMVVTDIEPQTA